MLMEDESLGDTTAVISKATPDVDATRSGLHVRITAHNHAKLAMMVRETGRCRWDIIERLIDMAKVGEYSE